MNQSIELLTNLIRSIKHLEENYNNQQYRYNENDDDNTIQDAVNIINQLQDQIKSIVN